MVSSNYMRCTARSSEKKGKLGRLFLSNWTRSDYLFVVFNNLLKHVANNLRHRSSSAHSVLSGHNVNVLCSLAN